LRKVALVFVEQLFQVLCAGFDVLLRIEGIFDAELLRGIGHKLHQAFRSFGRYRAGAVGGFLLDDGAQQRLLQLLRLGD